MSLGKALLLQGTGATFLVLGLVYAEELPAEITSGMSLTSVITAAYGIVNAWSVTTGEKERNAYANSVVIRKQLKKYLDVKNQLSDV
jgi:hypothetical protein